MSQLLHNNTSEQPNILVNGAAATNVAVDGAFTVFECYTCKHPNYNLRNYEFLNTATSYVGSATSIVATNTARNDCMLLYLHATKNSVEAPADAIQAFLKSNSVFLGQILYLSFKNKLADRRKAELFILILLALELLVFFVWSLVLAVQNL